jgi:hypothetical protein
MAAKIRIPTSLIDNVTTVAVDRQQGSSAIDFDINEFGPDYNTFNVNIGSQAANSGSLRLAIY